MSIWQRLSIKNDIAANPTQKDSEEEMTLLTLLHHVFTESEL